MIHMEYRYELHCHTAQTSPCSQLPAEELVRLYQAAGYDGVVITDHFTASAEGNCSETGWQTAVDRFLAGYEAANSAGAACGLTVILGAEIRFPGSLNDYLVYGLTEQLLRENEWLYEKDLPSFYQFAENNGLLVIQAHPFREPCTPSDPRYLHGVEVFNGHKGHCSHNSCALRFAQENGLIEIAGSDCHYNYAVGTAAVCFSRRPQSSLDIAVLLRTNDFQPETNRN